MDSPSPKIIRNHLQNFQIFVISLLFVDVINELPQFICLCKKKIIIVFIVNKLILIFFTCFVYTFVNYKYNVLLKRDDVCLMPLGTSVTLSRFVDGKEIRIVRNKIA